MSKHKRAQNKKRKEQSWLLSPRWGEHSLSPDEKIIVFNRTTSFIISQLSNDLMSARPINAIEFLKTRLEAFKQIFPKISYFSVREVRRLNARQEFYKINIFMYDGEITGSFILRSEHVEA
jgi:hypothetical protein